MQTVEIETPSAFAIDSESAANWYLRKLANIEAEKARIAAQAAQLVKQLESDAAGLRHLYEEQFQDFVREELQRRGGRRKSLVLLQGTAAFRTVPAGIKIADETAAFEYARTQAGTCIRTELDTAAYRKLAETALENGEVLPGVETIPERESFSVKFGKGE